MAVLACSPASERRPGTPTSTRPRSSSARSGSRKGGRAHGQGELIDAQLALGEVYERLGRYDAAKDAYQRARRMLKDDPIAEAQIWLRESWLPERVGNYSLCIRLVNQALKCIEGVEGAEADGASNGPVGRIRGTSATSKAEPRGDRVGAKAVEASERIGYRQGCAQAYLSMSLAYADTGDLKESRTVLRARARPLRGARAARAAGAGPEQHGHLLVLRRPVERGRRALGPEPRASAAHRGRGRGRERDQQRRRGAVRSGAPGGGGGLASARRCACGRPRAYQGAWPTRSRTSVASRGDGRPAEALPMLREPRGGFGASGFVAQVLETDAGVAECHLVAHQPGMRS